jgi:acetoin utilization protein AcuB
MNTRVVTTTPETSVEEAAVLLYDQNIGCLPVLENGKLVGIISDRDIFRVLIGVTGVRHGGVRIYLTIEDKPGTIKEVADIVRTHGYRLQSILTSYEWVKEGYRRLVIRTKGKGDFKGLRKELEEQYKGVSIIPAKNADELFTVLKGKTKG